MKLPWQCTEPDCESPKMGGLEVCASHASIERRERREASKPVKAARPLRRVPVQRYSEKQVDIKMELNATYEFLDNMVSQQDGGRIHCKAYPLLHEGNTTIDHSHTVSQDRCKKLGHPEWIYAEWNIEHCSRMAHEEWDRYKPEFLNHVNFSSRMGILRLHDPHDYDRRMEIWAKVNKPKETV